MRLLLRRLTLALAFGSGALAAPAAIILIEAAHAPRPELRDAASARALLRETRLAGEEHRAMAGGSALRGLTVPEPGSGY
jgi:hypothetical protein